MRLPHRFGRYVLTKKLATGGMAEIYRAKYIGEGGFEKTVAIKRLLPAVSVDRDFVTMLIDEAKALVHLQHKNIVQVLELGKEEQSFFISMELIEGLDLRCFFTKIIRDMIDVPTKYFVYIIGQILEALDFAHRQTSSDGRLLNIVHRDVSPQNVLLSWNGDVKVADFGIAKGAHRTYETTVTQVKGKYSYMSPEQASGQPVDSRTDIYAAGILLYELLTRRRLYDAPNDLEVIELVKRSKQPLESLKGLDFELKEILLKALKREKEKRYQTAQEFLAELNEYAFKHGQVTTVYEFGQFLRASFPAEAARHEEESTLEIKKTTTSARAKTRPFGKITQLGIKVGRASLSLRSGMMATLFACMFLPWAPQASHLSTSSPQIVQTLPIPEPKLTDGVQTISKPKEELLPATLSVQASPWGYVTVPGYAARTETPVRNLKVKPGTHLVKVYYEPADQWVTAKVETKSGASTNCLAVFGENPSLRCK